MKKLTAIFALITVLCMTGCEVKVVLPDGASQNSSGTVTGGAANSGENKTPVDASAGTDNTEGMNNSGQGDTDTQSDTSAPTSQQGATEPTRVWLEDIDTDMTFSELVGGNEVHGAQFRLKYEFPGAEITETCSFTDTEGLREVVTRIHLQDGYSIDDIDTITGGIIKAVNCEEGIGGNYVDYSSYDARLYPDWMGKSFDYCRSQIEG